MPIGIVSILYAGSNRIPFIPTRMPEIPIVDNRAISGKVAKEMPPAIKYNQPFFRVLLFRKSSNARMGHKKSIVG